MDKPVFTKEQVEKLKQWQNNESLHPYTCDRKADECEVKLNPGDYSKDGVLIPTEEGWICPCGKYRQYWSHE